jgi:hypothetical protein
MMHASAITEGEGETHTQGISLTEIVMRVHTTDSRLFNLIYIVMRVHVY